MGQKPIVKLKMEGHAFSRGKRDPPQLRHIRAIIKLDLFRLRLFIWRFENRPTALGFQPFFRCCFFSQAVYSKKRRKALRKHLDKSGISIKLPARFLEA